MPLIRMIIATLTLLICAGLAVPAPVQAEENPQRRLTLTGQGIVTAAPDIAVVSLGVVSQARTAREALSANTTAMQSLVGSLKSQGLLDKDLQTSNFSIQPRYVYPKRKQNGEQAPPRIVGYNVSNQLTAIVRELGRLGTILDEAVSTGSNQINSLRFSIDKPGPLRDEARKMAVKRAVEKAKLYAEAAGVALGPIMSISESGGHRPPRPVVQARALAREAASAPVPVERGEQAVTIQVSMTWEIR